MLYTPSWKEYTDYVPLSLFAFNQLSLRCNYCKLYQLKKGAAVELDFYSQLINSIEVMKQTSYNQLTMQQI